MQYSAPKCFECIHYLDKPEAGKLICKAFMYGIPNEILEGGHDHTKPFKGDGGIRFEPIKEGPGKIS